ncbi:HEAT repeat domain-containing protein [Bradyrhizobium oligotrophicum]|uniref:HEAT repeat domain-containing protein n=1 Tax=Bradyrhizobium oligotrophicum TaxID=44255 RepID=UPI003EB75069
MSHIPSAPLTHGSLRALLTRNDAVALTTLREAFAGFDQFIRRTAIEIIGRHPSGQDLRDLVLSALTDPSEYVVRAGCKIIEDWKWDAAHDVVAPLLWSTSWETRRAAIRALGAIWRQADFRPVFHIYSGDTEPAVRREAAWTLREQVTSFDWLQLFEAFRTDDIQRHRVWACDLAEKFGHPDATTLLDTFSSDRDGHVRKAAAKAIAALREREPGAVVPSEIQT